VKITEEMIAAYRPPDWPGLIGLPGEGFSDFSLPAQFFSGSWEAFPELDDDSGEPVAMLAYTTSIPKLAPVLDWCAVQHQAGGHLCDQPHFVGVRLSIREPMIVLLRDLCRRYFGAAGGHFYRANVLAGDIVSYVETLSAWGVSCDRSYRLLQEGVYPIDATSEALAILADSPPDLDVVQDKLDYGGLAIVILAENSD